MYQFFEKHSDKSKTFTFDHFKDEAKALLTIYEIIKRAENGISPERKPGSGKKPKIMTKSGFSKPTELLIINAASHGELTPYLNELRKNSTYSGLIWQVHIIQGKPQNS